MASQSLCSCLGLFRYMKKSGEAPTEAAEAASSRACDFMAHPGTRGMVRPIRSAPSRTKNRVCAPTGASQGFVVNKIGGLQGLGASTLLRNQIENTEPVRWFPA